MVPIDYRGIEPGTRVELSSEDLNVIEDFLMQNHPVHTVQLVVHEPYVYSESIDNLGALLGPMSALRNLENADSNVYYHALVDVIGPSINSVAGIANIASAALTSADRRVAATVWWDRGKSAGTLVHELGHNQGLSHVYCPVAGSTAAGADTRYPNDTGKITVWGFGIRDYRVYSPAISHDYMTYCGNAWASDWTWNKTYERITTLSGWDDQDRQAAHNALSPLLRGAVYGDGSSEWWTVDGAIDPDTLSANHRVRVVVDGETIESMASVEATSHPSLYWLTVSLPRGFRQISDISRWSLGERHDVDLATLHLAHRQIDLASL